MQARLAAEYVEKVKKLPESRAIDPATSKTMKDLKLKVVKCVSKEIAHFSFCHDVFKIALHSKYTFFQCSQPIPPGDETIHILAHYTRCKPDKMRWYLKKWMETEAHDNFVANIASDLLHRKGLTVKEYCENIVQPQCPLDEIAIVLFARMYKLHICVFVEGKFWTTNRNQAMKEADIYLVYCGKLKFLDTVRKGSLKEAVLNKNPSAQYYLRSSSPEKEKIPHNTKLVQVASRKTLNSLRAGLTKPSDLKQAVREYRKLNPEVSKDPCKQTKATPTQKKIKRKQKGALQVEHHGIKRRKPQNRKYFCPICKKIFPLRREVNLHVSKKHPNFKYKCRYCPKAYINYASKYKHQKSHGFYKNICKGCGKKFQFKKNLTVHKRTHTGRGLYRCPTCPLTYTTKRAMDYHFKVHMGTIFRCINCSFDTNTEANLRQHVRGAHGPGWVSPCGKRFSWPPKMFRHRKKCSGCQGIKKRKDTAAIKLARVISKQERKKSK